MKFWNMIVPLLDSLYMISSLIHSFMRYNFQNPSILGFDLPSSLKIKCDGDVGLFIYCFLLMFNNSIWHNAAFFMRYWAPNVSGLEFDLWGPAKIRCNGAVGLTIYEFLLISTSNHMSISHRWAVIGNCKLHPISIIWPQFSTPPPSPRGVFFLNLIIHFPWSGKISHRKMK